MEGYHQYPLDQESQNLTTFTPFGQPKFLQVPHWLWNFSQSSVTFAGIMLSGKVYQIDQFITEAISGFPASSNCTNLCSFFGLTNQLCTSTDTGMPLHPLLSTKNELIWTADHNQVFSTSSHDHTFNNTKNSLTKAPILTFCDASKPTCLCTDASREGLGFIVQQRTVDSKCVLI